MHITKKQLKSIIKEELAAIKEAGSYDQRGMPNMPAGLDPNQATQIIKDLKAIFRQFDAGVLTQPGNLELIKSKVDALVNMGASDDPVERERAELGDAADAFLGPS